MVAASSSNRLPQKAIAERFSALANNGLPGHVAVRSAYPPGADSQDGGAVGPDPTMMVWLR